EQSLADYISIAETVKNSSGLPELTASLLKPAEESLKNLIEKAYSTGQFRHFDTKSSNVLPGYMPPERKIESFSTLVKTPDSMGDDPERLVNYIKENTEGGFSVILMAESTGRERLLRNLLEESELLGRCTVKTGNLSESIEYSELKLSVISGSKLFRRARAHVKRKLRGQAITAFAELKPGDLVVHDVHGIGRFEGVEAIQIDGQKKDYIKIIYRDNGVIYVPAIQLDSVQKYIGGDENEPQLSKLGSSEWKRATGKVKNSLRVYAKELVELYARRSQIAGYAFNPDTEWQKDFEADFPYEETDDQLRCTDEIKEDMEKPRPMERLLCGDVGYGKTEVALRAAFKAVVEGKQVAFLVPTTVLAQQHYNNFVERFKKFPIKVDYLSRFRTSKERNALVKALKEGKVDIVVGTHALINEKIEFKNLGLVVVDEEQRFGVKHKEKLRSRYPAVDALTLSATPIPRTLHMSLSGIRDISVIEDPPQDRLPVQTYVAEWDPVMI
ncbi:MAG: DEAD/DEAH box helicase, partial [Clostridia bacterium]|nr:DEAD/DEAH box helicase [Clostridia bacterium]